MRTVKQIINSNLCNGCGTCFSFCPFEAIQLEIDNKMGIFIPTISEKKCNNCGICYNICPGHEVDFSSFNEDIFNCLPENQTVGNYRASYIGYSLDDNIRFNSASGGLVSSILIFALNNGIIDGALVTRMSVLNPFEPEIFIARTKEQILSASGSKYCPVPLNKGLRQIIEEEGNFAVVGLPCHIHGIRKVEKYNEILKNKIALHIGIFCANSVNIYGTERFLWDNHIDPMSVSAITYRGDGWPGKIVVSLKDGRKHHIERKSKNNTIFQKLNYNSAFHYDYMPKRCLVCRDLTCELADISFGDAWLPEIIETDNKGTSLVLARTSRGYKLLKNALECGVISLKEIEQSDLMRAQNYRFKMGWYSRLLCLKLLRKPVPRYTGVYSRFSIIDVISFIFYLPSYYSSNKTSFLLATKILAPLRESIKFGLDGTAFILNKIKNLKNGDRKQT